MEFLFTKTPLAFFVMDLWRDEAFSYVMSAQNVFDIIRTTAVDFNPPLYYLLLHYWMMLFGSTEIAMRSLSLIFFGLTLFILFEILVLIFRFSFKKALLYSLLIVLNPFLLFYAFEARMYMMVTFFITLSYYALWTDKKKLYVFAITTALYTHYFAIFIFIAQLILSLIDQIKAKPSLLDSIRAFIFTKKTFFGQIKSQIKKLFVYNTIFIFPVICFIPWALYLLSVHDFGSSDFWIIKPPLSDILYLPFVLYTGYERIFGLYYHGTAGYNEFHDFINSLLIALLTIPFLISFVSFFSTRFVNKKTLFVRYFANHSHWPVSSKYISAIVFWAFFPAIIIFLLSLVSTPLYHPRYYIYSVPGFILLIVLSLEFLSGFIASLFTKLKSIQFFQSGTIKTYLPFIFTIIFVSYAISITQRFSDLNLKYHYKRDVSSMYQEIMTVKQAGEPIYLTSELDYHLALYYTRSYEDIYIFNIPYEQIPSYVGKILIPEKVVVFQTPRYPVKAYILFYDTYEIYAEL